MLRTVPRVSREKGGASKGLGINAWVSGTFVSIKNLVLGAESKIRIVIFLVSISFSRLLCRDRWKNGVDQNKSFITPVSSCSFNFEFF